MADHICEEGRKDIRLENIRLGHVIFCQSERMHQFRSEILDKVQVPIVLPIGNSYLNHSREVSELFDCTDVRAIFVQNHVDAIPGVELLPIGLKNKWHANAGRTLGSRLQGAKHHSREFRVMWHFSFANLREEQINAANSLINCMLADRLGKPN